MQSLWVSGRAQRKSAQLALDRLGKKSSIKPDAVDLLMGDGHPYRKFERAQYLYIREPFFGARMSSYTLSITNHKGRYDKCAT